MHRFLLGSALILLAPTAALACNPPVVLVGADGQAEYISPNRNVVAEMEAIYGPAPQPDAILVVDARDRSGYWTGADTSLDYIELSSGATGDGFRYSGPDDCRPPEIPIALPEGDPKPPIELPDGRAPIELFGGIDPRSGLWQARLGETRLEGCPAIMQQYLSVSPGALPAEYMAPRRMEVEAPFHPDQLEMSRGLAAMGQSPITWRIAGDDAWRAEVLPEIFGQIPAGPGRGSQMIWRLAVKSETEIEHIVTVHISLPAEAAAVMGSAPDCRMTTINSWVR